MVTFTRAFRCRRLASAARSPSLAGTKDDEALDHAQALQDDAEHHVEYKSDGTRSFAVQTMYRESAAQTDPYSPEFYLEPGKKPPEVLQLAHLKYGGQPGKSLPAGRAEIEAIELARRRARIEASLPPTTDEASFEIRRTLMEHLELAAFQARENEIDTAHEDKLAVVEQQLRAREAEREFVAEQRVEEMRRKFEAEKEASLAIIANKRIKLLRKMGKQRQQHETHIDMLTGTGAFVGVSSGSAGGASKGRKTTRDIIAEYADYGSRVYAPSVKEGRFPDKLRAAAKLEVRAVELETANGLSDLTQTLPSTAFNPTIIRPDIVKATTSGARQQEAIAKDLERVHEAIAAVKAGKSTVAVENEDVPAWRKPKPVIQRPKTPTFDQEDEGVDDVEVELALLLMQTLLRGRAVQNVMFEGKERRLELIHEMRADLLTSDAVAIIEKDEAARKKDDDGQIGRNAVVDTATGEVTSATLDFFSKELVRQQEMQNVAAAAAIADEERRKREAAETALRRAEFIARSKQEEIARQLRSIHSSTASTLIESIIAQSIDDAASAVAALEAEIRHRMLGPILDDLEAVYQPPSTTSMVADLVSSVVVPAVNIELKDTAAVVEDSHFAAASSDAVAVATAATMRHMLDADEAALQGTCDSDLMPAVEGTESSANADAQIDASAVDALPESESHQPKTEIEVED
jgi:hypothetical protein